MQPRWTKPWTPLILPSTTHYVVDSWQPPLIMVNMLIIADSSDDFGNAQVLRVRRTPRAHIRYLKWPKYRLWLVERVLYCIKYFHAYNIQYDYYHHSISSWKNQVDQVSIAGTFVWHVRCTYVHSHSAMQVPVDTLKTRSWLALAPCPFEDKWHRRWTGRAMSQA